jgi:hypothetical protein
MRWADANNDAIDMNGFTVEASLHGPSHSYTQNVSAEIANAVNGNFTVSWTSGQANSLLADQENHLVVTINDGAQYHVLKFPLDVVDP